MEYPYEILPNSFAALLPRPIQLQLLNHFDLFVDRESRASQLTYDKPRLLLAILALANGEALSRNRLAHMLWPNLSESQGKTRFRHALHVLRQALGSHHTVLQSHDDRLAIAPESLQVDVIALLADGPSAMTDEMCLTLYRGALLEDLCSRMDGPLDEWFQHWNQRLNTRMAQCRQRLVSMWTAEGRVQNALTQARQWIQRWPGEDSCHQLLIDLLVRDKRYTEARQAYDQYAAMLRLRADTQPDEHTQALIAKLPPPTSLSLTPNTDGQQHHYRPLAVLTVTLRCLVENAASLLQTDALTWLHRVDLAVRRNAQLYGGWVAPAGANQLIIYFGFPNRSERPVLRAVALARTLRELPLPRVLSMHMGVHADIGLCDDSQPDYGNLLAQTALTLAAHGNWSEILLTAQAHARMMEYDVLETRRNGKMVRLLGNTSAPELQKAVGRATELNMLLQTLRRCDVEASNETMSIIGVPGAGKSLLASNLAWHASQMDTDVVWLQCLQDQQTHPLHPLRLWLMSRLPASLDPVTDEMLSTALGLPVAMCTPLANLFRLDTPAHRTNFRPETLEIASRAIMSPWRPDRPLLIVFEDIQWADAVTKEWLALLANTSLGRCSMLLTTQRGTLTSPRIASDLLLDPLDEKAYLDIASQRARKLKLDKSTLADIARLGGGDPSHLTALMTDIAIKGPQEMPGNPKHLTLPQEKSWIKSGAAASQYQPVSLTDRLYVQLPLLDAGTRKLAYLCALFDAPLSTVDATSIMLCSEQTLHQRLKVLQSSGIVSAHANHTWSCPMLVAHIIRGQLSPAEHEQLTQEIAQYLLNAELPPVRVAHFLEQIKDARAPISWKDAATTALRAGQLHEADALISKALSCNELIPSDAERDQFVFECQMLKSTTSSALSGPAHPETAASYLSTTTPASSGDLGAMIVALWGQWMLAQNSGNHSEALRLAQQLTHAANTVQDLNIQGWAVYALAQYYLWRGSGREAQSLLSHAETMLANAPTPAMSPFGANAQALVPASLALAYGLQGKYPLAFAAIERAIQLSATGDSAWISVLCRLSCARIHYLKGELDLARQQSQYIVQHTTGIAALTPWQAIAVGYAMLPEVLTRQDPQALAAMEAALPAIRQGMPVSVDGHLCLLARAYIAMSDIPRAMTLLDEAHTLGHAHDSISLRSEIHCLRGDAWHYLGDLERARASWQHAYDEAKTMALVPYEQWANTRLLALEADTQAQFARPRRAMAR